MSIFELLHPDDVDRTRDGFNLTQQGQPAIEFPNRYRCKDGSYRWISWVGVPEDGMVYCTGRDITRQTEQAEALKQAEEILRQSQKMEAIGQLTGGLAHDFNNMLAVIISGINLVERRLAKGEDVKRFLDGISDAAKRAASLTQRLLAFSRQSTLAPQVIDTNQMVKSISELLRQTLGETTVLETVLAGGLWQTHADAGQLENAILNLAINARDAMPEGEN